MQRGTNLFTNQDCPISSLTFSARSLMDVDTPQLSPACLSHSMHDPALTVFGNSLALFSAGRGEKKEFLSFVCLDRTWSLIYHSWRPTPFLLPSPPNLCWSLQFLFCGLLGSAWVCVQARYLFAVGVCADGQNWWYISSFPNAIFFQTKRNSCNSFSFMRYC